MSIARNGINGGHFYSNLAQPLEIDLSFAVDAANGNGLGCRSIKSNGFVEHVFMHTSATPATGSPNPAAGLILIQLKNNFRASISGSHSIVSPVAGSPSTSTTAHAATIIVSLGTASLAQWQAVGLPKGVVPAVGVAFVATATAAIGGSAAVEAPAASGVMTIEIVGDPNLSQSNPIASQAGQWILMQCLSDADVLAAPADGSVISLRMLFDQSSVTIDGI